MAATPSGFYLGFWLNVIVTYVRIAVNPAAAGESNFLTDRRRIPAGGEVIQIRVCTDHYKNSTYPPSPNRIQVVRVIMDFWQPLDDLESEVDVFGGGNPRGQMHIDFENYGGVDFWRDYDSVLGGIRGIDTEGGAPEFFSERIKLMAHYRISVGLELAT